MPATAPSVAAGILSYDRHGTKSSQCCPGGMKVQKARQSAMTLSGLWSDCPFAAVFARCHAETKVEKQFADLRDIHTANKFVEYLNSEISNRFTDDYFKYTLPS